MPSDTPPTASSARPITRAARRSPLAPVPPPARSDAGPCGEPDLLPFALNRLMAAWNARLAARLEALGATFPQWRVLMVAARAEGALTIVELAERTLVPHSTLSRQIAAMERAGLVRRDPSPDDARAVRVVLTPRGRARYRELLPLALDVTETGLMPLTRDERATLARLVGRLSENTP